MSKQTFLIAIEETHVQEFEIEANDAGEAMAILERQYLNGEIRLDDATFESARMAIDMPVEEATDWVEIHRK